MSYQISHCEGILCPLKDRCNRNDYFRMSGNSGIRRFEKYESFIDTEFEIKNKKFECKNFMGNEIEIIKYNLKRKAG